MILEIEEHERQVVLLALAHLSNERPGWDGMLNRIALRIDNESAGRAATYDAFKALHTDRAMPADVLGMAMREKET